MSGNDATLRTYDATIQAYVDGTSHAVEGPSRDWLERALDGLAPSARIFELGSAFGRDAAFMAARGFRPECSDAVDGFIARLRQQGFAARLFNALHDPLPGPYDLILANAVMLHFTAAEFALVAAKLYRALAPGGRFAFSLKRGDGEEWSDAKLGAPRFFHYWQPENLPAALSTAGFAAWDIAAAHTGRTHADWLYVIAQAG